MQLIKYIPNAVTCGNLFSGAIATTKAIEGAYEWALFFIILGAVFDFFDGMLARALNARSPIGGDLDSLADDITFGLAPAAMLYSLFSEMTYPAFMTPIESFFPYLGFVIAVFSALRLAKFNIDTRQKCSFIGLPVPANALFWASLIAWRHDQFISSPTYLIVLVVLVGIFSWFLISEVPMFSLKFKNLKWSSNKISFIFLMGCLPLLIILQIGAFAIIIIWYILLSLITQRKLTSF